jgi:hypothetical protein
VTAPERDSRRQPARKRRDRPMTVAEWVRKVSATAPPLTEAQRERLRVLLDLGNGDDTA